MNAKSSLTVFLVLAGLIIVFSAGPAAAQVPEKPSYSGYKGVFIGTKMDEARTKLGNPRERSDSEDYYVFSDNETAQVLYDSDHTVRVISVNYITKLDGAPMPKAVFGSDVEAKPDGSVNKMIRYPKAGYWISYLRTAGDEPMIVITVQKMQGNQ